MSTSYTGYQPFTWGAQPSGEGRFIAGMAADDGDDDDAAHLMALAMAAMDNTQFLAWRTFDIVSGGTYLWTATISLRNTFTWTAGAVKITGSSSLQILANSWIANSATLFVGDDTAGLGNIKARRGSNILADGSFGSAGTALIGATASNAQLVAQNGADVEFDDQSNCHYYGANVFGDATGSGLATFQQQVRMLGDFATVAWRQHNADLGDTIADGTLYDTIRVSSAGYAVSGGGGASGIMDFDPPADDTTVGIRVRFYVPLGAATGGGGSDIGYLTVRSTGPGTPELGKGYAWLDGSGHLKTPIWVELQVVATGTHTRAWEAIESSMPSGSTFT